MIFIYVMKWSSQLSVVDTHHHTSLYFFLIMGNFNIYSLSNFQIKNTVLLTLVTMLFITSPELIYIVTGNWYFLTTFTHFAHPYPQLLPTNLFSISMSLVFFRFHIYVRLGLCLPSSARPRSGHCCDSHCLPSWADSLPKWCLAYSKE